MRTGINFSVSADDRLRLEAIVVGRTTPQKHVWRARIVLLSADGLGTHAIMAATGKSKTCVWRWQERYMAQGVDGLQKVEVPAYRATHEETFDIGEKIQPALPKIDDKVSITKRAIDQYEQHFGRQPLDVVVRVEASVRRVFNARS